MRWWLYKMTYDNGGAPCAHGSVLSLAICKPMIRAWAKPGDWIAGFGGRSRPQIRGERLIYLAEVAEVLPPTRYYEDPKYSARPDCIYTRKNGVLVWKEGARYHPYGSGTHSDLGPAPLYPKAQVLLCTNYRYFGIEGTEDYKLGFPVLGSTVEAKARGQNAYEASSEVGKALQRLQQKLWAEYPKTRILGRPTEDPEHGSVQNEENEPKVLTRSQCASPGSSTTLLPKPAKRARC